MRLIDADALEKEGWSLHRTIRVDRNTDEYQTKPLKKVPTIEPERKKGRFVGTEYDGYADGNPVFCEWVCSECGCVFEDDEPTYNYCPNCGADMRKEVNE